MKSKALFLDRDGVINEDYGFIGSADRFVFREGAVSFLRAARGMGFRLVVVTNQSGVARGYYTEEDYGDVNAHMLAALAQEGVTIESVEACFEIKGAEVPAYARDSFWRKPNPGMILDAARRLGIDLSRSAMIGDRDGDMRAAKAATLPLRFFMAGGSGVPDLSSATHIVVSFDEVLEILRC